MNDVFTEMPRVFSWQELDGLRGLVRVHEGFVMFLADDGKVYMLLEPSL